MKRSTAYTEKCFTRQLTKAENAGKISCAKQKILARIVDGTVKDGKWGLFWDYKSRPQEAIDENKILRGKCVVYPLGYVFIKVPDMATYEAAQTAGMSRIKLPDEVANDLTKKSMRFVRKDDIEDMLPAIVEHLSFDFSS